MLILCNFVFLRCDYIRCFAFKNRLSLTIYGHLAENLNVILHLFIRFRWGFHQKSQNSIQKTYIKFLPFLSWIFVLMPNLDIFQDVIITVTWDKINHFYQPTFLPSFVAFDAFYFCLWPKTLSFERCGSKSPSNRPPCPI